ncbi:MAG: hypothetical protein SGI90_00525 [Candidatus Eisenbacteria bacterium]|nr:hypothetical protein [Candidatus Eisenbacteria bacterium]
MMIAEPSLFAPAKFVGIKDGFGFIPPFELYTLDAPVGKHPIGSTVSRETLENTARRFHPPAWSS